MRHRVRALGLVVVLLGTSHCSCEDELSSLKPEIKVTPAVIDMGRRVVGQTSQAGFVVGNEGTAAVDIISYTIEPMSDELAAELGVELDDESGAAFSVVEGPGSVGTRRSAEGKIGFSPPAQARYGGVLNVRSNDPERPLLRIPLLGEGGPPLIEADPASVDFGVVNEGPGASRIVRLVNVGYDVLHISDLFLEGPLADAGAEVIGFSLNPEQPTSADVTVQQALSVEVRMSPSEVAVALAGGGRLLGKLVALSDAENAPRLEVPLAGDANLAPRAVAVELVSRRSEVKVGLGREVTIDGSETEDPEGDPFVFSWSLAEKPADSEAVLLGNTVSGSCTDDDDCQLDRGFRCAQGTCKQVAWTRVTPDAVGTFVVRLRATDARGAWREAEARILPRDLAVVLEWSTLPGDECFAPDSSECLECSAPAGVCNEGSTAQRRRCCQQLYCCGQNDLDLHLVRPEGSAGDYGTCPGECVVTETPDGGVPSTVNRCYEEGELYVDSCRQQGGDCSFANRYPDWFLPGRDDDPRLDLDDVRGFGPEVITLNEPADGVYSAVVHYFTDRIGEPAVVTVKVYVEGELAHTAGPQIVTSSGDRCEDGQTWVAASLIRSGGPEDGSWSVVSVPDLFDDGASALVCAGL